MKKCPSCGADIDMAHADFCPYCGNALKPEVMVPVELLRPSPPRRKGIGKGWKVALIVAGIGLLALIVVAVFVVFSFLRVVIAPADTVNQYLEAVDDERFVEALNLLSEESPYRNERDIAGLKDESGDASLGSLDTWEVKGVEITGSNAEVLVELEHHEDRNTEAVFELVKEAGKWRITRID